jgi:hypothetical protein
MHLGAGETDDCPAYFGGASCDERISILYGLIRILFFSRCIYGMVYYFSSRSIEQQHHPLYGQAVDKVGGVAE